MDQTNLLIQSLLKKLCEIRSQLVHLIQIDIERVVRSACRSDDPFIHQSMPDFLQVTLEKIIRVLVLKPNGFVDNTGLLNYAYKCAKNLKVQTEKKKKREIVPKSGFFSHVADKPVAEESQEEILKSWEEFLKDRKIKPKRLDKMLQTIRLTFDGNKPKAIASIVGVSRATITRYMQEAEILLVEKVKVDKTKVLSDYKE